MISIDSSSFIFGGVANKKSKIFFFEKVKNTQLETQSMDFKISEEGENTVIRIPAEKEIAVAVHIDGQERIFLPKEASSDSTYYVERTKSLIKTENGFKISFNQRPEKVEILN